MSDDRDRADEIASFDLRVARELTKKARSLRDTGEIERSIAVSPAKLPSVSATRARLSCAISFPWRSRPGHSSWG